MTSEAPAVRARGLRRAFGEVRAVDGVDLDVPPRSLFGLVGPDAAGKTTLLRLLVGVVAADAGELELLGAPVTGAAARRNVRDELRLRIGYMSQRFSLYRDLTVSENIRFFGSLRRVPAADREARAARVLEATGLAPFTSRHAGNLSGGMKQKLGLVCTLVHEPDLLFLDEPTNGVDPVSRREFWSLLGELRERLTIVVATPSLDEAARCDHVALMHEGRVLLVDTPQGLRDRVTDPVWEIEVDEPFVAAEALRRAFPKASTELFGDRVHVIGALGASALETALPGPARIERVSPTLEDAYVQLFETADGEPTGVMS
ncbi:MAG: ABC transporter ATP-binding protein [Myxococcota bacterium]